MHDYLEDAMLRPTCAKGPSTSDSYLRTARTPLHTNSSGTRASGRPTGGTHCSQTKRHGFRAPSRTIAPPPTRRSSGRYQPRFWSILSGSMKSHRHSMGRGWWVLEASSLSFTVSMRAPATIALEYLRE